MARIEAGHWQFGIYHARRQSNGTWCITVEDGKGFPFDPLNMRTLRSVREWLGV